MANNPNDGPSRKQDVKVLQTGQREGYYLSESGEWLPDRRVNAERRSDPIPLHIRGMRKYVRRRADREMLEFLQSMGSDPIDPIEIAS